MRESKLVIKFEYMMVMKLIIMLKKLGMPPYAPDFRIACENHIIRLNPNCDDEYSFTLNNFYADRDYEWCHD